MSIVPQPTTTNRILQPNTVATAAARLLLQADLARLRRRYTDLANQVQAYDDTIEAFGDFSHPGTEAFRLGQKCTAEMERLDVDMDGLKVAIHGLTPEEV